MKLGKIIGLLFLTVSLFVLSACGSSSPDLYAQAQPEPYTAQAPIEITFAHIHGGATGEIINVLSAEFYEVTQGRINVTPLFVEGSYEGLLERLQLLGLSNDLPEITQGGHQYLYFMSENLPIVPMQTFIDRDGYDYSDIFPKMMDLARNSEGEILGFPFAVSTPILFYNRDLIEYMGIEIPTTFDQLREVAKQLTTDGMWGVYINYPITGNWIVQSLIENFGEQILSPDRCSVGFYDAGLSAFELLNTLVNIDQTMPIAETGEGAITSRQMFMSGMIAMFLDTSAALRHYQNGADFRVGTATHPSVGEELIAAPAGGNSLYILSQNPAKQDAAWEFLQWLAEPAQASRVSQNFGYMVISQRAYNTPEYMGNFLIDNPEFQVTYTQVDVLTTWANFPGGGTRYVRITQDNIEAMLHGQMTPQEALSATVLQLNDLIAQEAR